MSYKIYELLCKYANNNCYPLNDIDCTMELFTINGTQKASACLSHHFQTISTFYHENVRFNEKHRPSEIFAEGLKFAIYK